MVKKTLEDFLMIDKIYASAVEKLAKEKEIELKPMVHKVMRLSSPDVSLREFKRIISPDAKGRKRTMTLREAFDFARSLLMTIDDVLAYGISHSNDE